MIHKTFYLLAVVFLVIAWLWCIAAIYFMLLPAAKIPLIISALFAFNLPFIFFLLPNRNQAMLIAFALCALVFLYWTQIKPSHDRNWVANVGKLPYAQVEANSIKVFNIRNFEYTSEHEYQVRYYDKAYDLTALKSVDYILSYWDGNKTIAHVILSFGFDNGDHLAVSVETRLEQNELQGSIAGFFKQFELIYILADESDVLRLRTNFRKEEVYLYPTTVEKAEVRKLFDVVIKSVNDLHQQAEFYNTLTDNCFSNLAAKFKNINNQHVAFDFRRIAIGYSDAMLYEQGKIETDLNFAAAKNKFHINQYVQDDDSSLNYSVKIRPE